MPPPPPEIEVKVPLHRISDGHALVAALPASSRGPEQVDRVRDAYYDTAERELLGAGYAFRVRTTNGGAFEATLTSLGRFDDEDVAVRDERTVALEGPLRDPRLLPDGPLRRVVASIAGSRPLVPFARVAGTRLRRRLRVDADLVAGACIDRLVVSAGGRAVPFLELELGCVKGDEATFRAWLERAWRGRRRTRGGPTPFERALSLARIPIPSAVRVAAARLSLEEVGPATPSARAGARDLARGAAALERAIAGARRGAVEGVHDVRTLSRRLRALLAFHAPELDDATIDDARTRLRALRRAAGPTRDLDVLCDALRAAPLPRPLETGRALLLDAARAERAKLRTRLSKALAAPRLATPAARWAKTVDGLSRRTSIPFALSAAIRLPRTLGATLASRRLIPDSIADAGSPRVHALRIASKRVRYSVDACLPALGKPAKRFAKRTRAFVDAVGALCDAEAQGEAVRRLVRLVPRLAGERTAAERAAATLCETFDATAAAARASLDARYDAAFGPASLREFLGHLAIKAAAAT